MILNSQHFLDLGETKSSTMRICAPKVILLTLGFKSNILQIISEVAMRILKRLWLFWLIILIQNGVKIDHLVILDMSQPLLLSIPIFRSNPLLPLLLNQRLPLAFATLIPRRLIDVYILRLAELIVLIYGFLLGSSRIRILRYTRYLRNLGRL